MRPWWNPHAKVLFSEKPRGSHDWISLEVWWTRRFKEILDVATAVDDFETDAVKCYLMTNGLICLWGPLGGVVLDPRITDLKRYRMRGLDG